MITTNSDDLIGAKRIPRSASDSSPASVTPITGAFYQNTIFIENERLSSDDLEPSLSR